MKKLCAFSWFGGKFSHLNWLLPIVNSIECKHYCDPPYPMETRTGGKAYKKEFDKHEELLDLLISCKGKVILSSYNNEIYDKKLCKWNKILKDYSCASGRITGESKRQEVLYVKP